MKINIYGSTGFIGSKILSIIKSYFPEIKINLLLANENYKKLISQTKMYNPNIICINNSNKVKYLKQEINNKSIKIVTKHELKTYLINSKSDLSILSISGYNSLFYLQSIIKNTYNLGLVNKECVVSAGHIFKKIIKKKQINIYPLDSEHFSLFNHFKYNKKLKYTKIFLTASGGPFFTNNIKSLKKVTFVQAINHPKWKMGYKNSIDSATLSNKCLELIEAHYLFDIPFNKLDVLIHPESLIHSIIQNDNYTTSMNYFYHDMFIPLYNFLKTVTLNQKINKYIPKYNFNINSKFNFFPVDIKRYPIYDIFNQLDKTNPVNLIKFNCSNEFAVDLFKNNVISYNKIYDFIEKSLSINLNSSVKDVESIIDYQKELYIKLKEIYV